MIVKNLSSNSDHGVHFFDHRVQTDHGVFIFSDHGVQMPLGEGSKVNTPSADCHRFSNHSKIKQEIPATSNVPESLVFSGFPNILFMPFVSNKRFTFPRTRLSLQILFLLRYTLTSATGW